jgi:hypothetical protein
MRDKFFAFIGVLVYILMFLSNRVEKSPNSSKKI